MRKRPVIRGKMHETPLCKTLEPKYFAITKSVGYTVPACTKADPSSFFPPSQKTPLLLLLPVLRPLQSAAAPLACTGTVLAPNAARGLTTSPAPAPATAPAPEPTPLGPEELERGTFFCGRRRSQSLTSSQCFTDSYVAHQMAEAGAACTHAQN